MSELVSPQTNQEDYFNFTSRNNGVQIQDNSHIMHSGDNLKDFETRTTGNVIQITAGIYTAYVPSVINTSVVCTGNVVFQSSRIDTDPLSTSGLIVLDTKVANANFMGSVAVQSGATAIFNNCTFNGTITVAAGSNANFIGCLFQNAASVQNSGTAFINGCSRKSSIAHAGITATFGETT